MIQQRVAVLLLFAGAISFSCLWASAGSTPSYGAAYNPERVKIGLPILPKNWRLDSSMDAESRWYSPTWKQQYASRIPVHYSKYVNFREGQLRYETDEYYGIEDWNCEGSACREQLLITYCYQADSQCHGKSGWSVDYLSEKTAFTQEISLGEAKRILEGWGLSYP